MEDCPLDEDEDAFQGLGEEDEEIDQFNDDTFGSGAVDDDWQEAHERLAELEEKLPVAVSEQTGNGEREMRGNVWSLNQRMLGDQNPKW